MKKFRVYPDGTVENKNGVTRGNLVGKGYLAVWNPRTKKKESVHRLVAKRYCPNPNGYKEVNHIDGVKTNNHYTNLEWCNRSQNNKHAHQMGLNKMPCSIGSKNGFAKLNDELVKEIKSLFSTHKVSEIARMFDMSWSAVDRIKKGRTWTHVEVDDVK